MRNRFGWAMVALGAVAMPAAAHEDLSRFVHHAASFSVSAQTIDVTLRLTFFGDLARIARARIDVNDDRRISGNELRVYSAGLVEETGGAAEITESDTKLETVPLYDPVVDVQGDWTRSGTQLVIELSYFARRNDAARDETTVRLRETLWMEAPALCLVRDNVLTNGVMQNPPPSRAKSGQAREFVVRARQRIESTTMDRHVAE